MGRDARPRRSRPAEASVTVRTLRPVGAEAEQGSRGGAIRPRTADRVAGASRRGVIRVIRSRVARRSGAAGRVLDGGRGGRRRWPSTAVVGGRRRPAAAGHRRWRRGRSSSPPLVDAVDHRLPERASSPSPRSPSSSRSPLGWSGDLARGALLGAALARRPAPRHPPRLARRAWASATSRPAPCSAPRSACSPPRSPCWRLVLGLLAGGRVGPRPAAPRSIALGPALVAGAARSPSPSVASSVSTAVRHERPSASPPMTVTDDDETGRRAVRPARRRGRRPAGAGAARPARPPASSPARVAEARHRNPTWIVAGVLLVCSARSAACCCSRRATTAPRCSSPPRDLEPGEADRARRPAHRAGRGRRRRARRCRADGRRRLVGAAPGRAGSRPARCWRRRCSPPTSPLGADEVVVGAALDPGEAPLSQLEVGARSSCSTSTCRPGPAPTDVDGERDAARRRHGLGRRADRHRPAVGVGARRRATSAWRPRSRRPRTACASCSSAAPDDARRRRLGRRVAGRDPPRARARRGVAGRRPRGRVVVEADPDGGRLGAELGVGVEPGLMALALAARDGGLTGRRPRRTRRGARSATGTSSRRRRRPSRRTRRSSTPPARSPRVDGRRPDGPVWLVDAGRLSARSPALPFARLADHVVVVTAGVVPGAAAACRTASRRCATPAATSSRRRRRADVVVGRRDRRLRRRRRGRRAAAGVGRAATGIAAMRRQRVAAVVAPGRGRRAPGLDAREPSPEVRRERRPTVRLEEVIEAVQEALVTAEAGADGAPLGRPRAGGVRPRRRHVLRRPPGPGGHRGRRDADGRRRRGRPHPPGDRRLLPRRQVPGPARPRRRHRHHGQRPRRDLAAARRRPLERYREPIFADADDLRDEVAHLARRAGGTERRFDDAKPMLVLRLPDGSRLAAIMNVSPVPQVAIRRNVLPDASLDELERAGHDRPGDALAAGGGDGRRHARRRVRARPAPARRRWCGR